MYAFITRSGSAYVVEDGFLTRLGEVPMEDYSGNRVSGPQGERIAQVDVAPALGSVARFTTRRNGRFLAIKTTPVVAIFRQASVVEAIRRGSMVEAVAKSL